MIRTLPTSKTYNRCFKLYVVLYFAFLFAPLLVTCVLAFNTCRYQSSGALQARSNWQVSALK